MSAALEEGAGTRRPTATAAGCGIAAAAGRLGALVRVSVEWECAGGVGAPGTTLRLA